VFVAEDARGNGHATTMLNYIFHHPKLKDLKWLLATLDLHHYYARFGFTSIKNVERFMGKNGWTSFEEFTQVRDQKTT
jgi:N-acetylglutamate synthase-like GNAT family acetyltransferase